VEVGELSSKVSALTNQVSSILSLLRDYGAEVPLSLNKQKLPPLKKGGRPRYAYWMEKNRDNQLSDVEQSSELLHELSKARLLLNSLVHNSARLAEIGISPPPEDILQLFSEVEATELEDQASEILAEYLDLLNTDNADKTFSMNQDDPRWKLVDYLEKEVYSKDLAMQVKSIFDESQSVNKKTWSSLSREDRRYRQRQIKNLRKKIAPIIKGTIHTMADAGLLNGGSPSEVIAAIAGDPKNLAEEQMVKTFQSYEHTHLPPHSIVLAVLLASNGTLRGYGNLNFVTQAVDSSVAEGFAKYYEENPSNS
jgi:hypothetical protein